MVNPIAETVNARIRRAVEMSSRTNGVSEGASSFIVYGEQDDEIDNHVVKYLREKGFIASFVDINTVADWDSIIDCDAPFLPIVVDNKTGKAFIGNPEEHADGFEVWREYIARW